MFNGIVVLLSFAVVGVVVFFVVLVLLLTGAI